MTAHEERGSEGPESRPTADETVWAAYRSWALGTRGLGMRTLRCSISTLRKLEGLGLVLEPITLDGARQFLADRQAAGTPRKTEQSWVREINRWLAFRGSEDKLPYFRGVHYGRRRVPSDEELERLLSVHWPQRHIDSRNRAMLRVAAVTGVRVSELVALNLQDIEGDLVYIRHGKGDKPRIVVLDGETRSSVEEYVRTYRPSGRNDSGALWRTLRRRLTYAYARKVIKDAGSRAGLPWMSWHSIRHWRGRQLVRSGVDVTYVQALFGHEDLRTTQIYTSPTPEEALEAVRRKGFRFFRGESRLMPDVTFVKCRGSAPGGIEPLWFQPALSSAPDWGPSGGGEL